jgi:RHS repeat-associated protein
MAGISSKAAGLLTNKIKFGGKELQSNEFSDGSGLEQYDFTARTFDHQIGRFTTPDPLAEKFYGWNPYTYSYNNPVRFGDPTGMSGTDWVKKDGQWNYNEEIKTSEQATAAGYDDFVENGSTIEGASINGGRVGAVYLGNSASDVAYSENNFTNWNTVHGSEYDNQVEAHRAWQSDPNYHVGEGKWDKIFRGIAYGSMEARREYASGGMNMFGGYGAAGKIAAAETQALDGSFSIWNWKGYPSGIPKPNGPFRLIAGEEYAAARTAANDANRAISADLGLRNTLVDVHEIVPVKFGGSPTNINNKIFLDRSFHQQQVTPFWNMIMRSMK